MGTAHDEHDLYSGVTTEAIDAKTFGASEGIEYTYYRWRILVTGIKRAVGANVGNLELLGFTPTDTSSLTTNAENSGSEKMVAVDNSSDYVYFYIPSARSSGDIATAQETLSSLTLYYEKATYSTNQGTPILNNLLPTEAGGTIESVLTNPVDDSMTLGYLNL